MKVSERLWQGSRVGGATVTRAVSARRHGWLASLFAIAAIGMLPVASFAFIDDFEDGNLSEWIVKCGGWQFVEGFGGGLAVASTQFDNVLLHSTFTGSYGHYHYEVYFPNAFWADGDLMFQIVGPDFYWLLLGPDNSDNAADRIIRATIRGTGPQSALACAPFHLSRESWHRIDVYRFPNGVIQVFMDNESTPRMEAHDFSITGAGRIAIRTAGIGCGSTTCRSTPSYRQSPACRHR